MTQEPKKVAQSIEELFAYASQMERNTAERYRELGEMMGAHNNRELAELFKRMAEIEWLHVYNVSALCREMDIEERAPTPRSVGKGEVPDFEDMHYLHWPYHALMLARGYEVRAQEFYANMAEAAEDEDIRKAALKLAAEEEMHVQELDKWLVRYPKPEEGWDEDLDPPVELE